MSRVLLEFHIIAATAVWNSLSNRTRTAKHYQ